MLRWQLGSRPGHPRRLLKSDGLAMDGRVPNKALNFPPSVLRTCAKYIAGQCQNRRALTDDGCGNLLSSSEKRQAIIRREVRSGMSSADVESSLGKPDRITRQNGRQRYHYRDKRGDNQLISFDEAGCVKK